MPWDSIIIIIANYNMIVKVFIGEYLIYTLDNKLIYDVGVSQNPSNLSTIIPAILVPLLVVIIAVVALIVGVIYFNVIRTKRTLNLEMIGKGGERCVVPVKLNNECTGVQN